MFYISGCSCCAKKVQLSAQLQSGSQQCLSAHVAHVFIKHNRITKNEYIVWDQPSKIRPASITVIAVLRELGCMQYKITLSSFPPCSLQHPCMLQIKTKKKIEFYGFTISNPGMHLSEWGK